MRLKFFRSRDFYPDFKKKTTFFLGDLPCNLDIFDPKTRVRPNRQYTIIGMGII